MLEITMVAPLSNASAAAPPAAPSTINRGPLSLRGTGGGPVQGPDTEGLDTAAAIETELGPGAPCLNTAVEPPPELRFRNYRLLPCARMLLRDDEPVLLGSRAFDLLHILLRERGRLVTKEAIVAQVWPSTIVEESNLRFQMAALRRSLEIDRDLIKTIPGRGYLFAADLPQHELCPDVGIFPARENHSLEPTSTGAGLGRHETGVTALPLLAREAAELVRCIERLSEALNHCLVDLKGLRQ